MESNFIGYIIAFVVGAAVPIFINWLEIREKRKQFELERKDKYKLVAIEKRLEAHQQAYNQTMQFMKAMDYRDKKKVQDVFKNGQDFFSKNSLYLGEKVREKFSESLGFLNAYCPRWDYLNEFKMEDRTNELKKYHKESEKIFELARLIQTEVELEPIDMVIDKNAESK